MSRFVADTRGNLLVVTGIAVLAIATASFAIDYSRKSSADSELQKVADAAVAAAVNPADLPADETAAIARRRDIIENYIRNSKAELSEATLMGSPDITVTAHDALVVLQAHFDSTWSPVLQAFMSKPRPSPNMAVRSAAQW